MVGEINSKGIKTKKKEEAGGHNEWIMVKVRLPLRTSTVSGHYFPKSGKHEFGTSVYLQASLFSLARKYLYLYHTNP